MKTQRRAGRRPRNDWQGVWFLILLVAALFAPLLVNLWGVLFMGWDPLGVDVRGPLLAAAGGLTLASWIPHLVIVSDGYLPSFTARDTPTLLFWYPVSCIALVAVMVASVPVLALLAGNGFSDVVLTLSGRGSSQTAVPLWLLTLVLWPGAAVIAFFPLRGAWLRLTRPASKAEKRRRAARAELVREQTENTRMERGPLRHRPAKWWRSGRPWREAFVRKMIRADYRGGDKLFGGVDECSDEHDTRLYLRRDRAGRSKFIGDRVFYLVNNTVAAAVFAMLTVASIALLGEARSTGGVIGTVVGGVLCSALFMVTAWYALKSSSWLRWMVRNWNAPAFARPRGDALTRAQRLERRAHEPTAPTPAVVLEIAGVWFVSEFVRRHVLADYRPGDRVFWGFKGLGRPSWDRPEEFLGSGKGWRGFMVLYRLFPLGMSVFLLFTLRPAQHPDGLDPPQIGLALVCAWVALISQSWLRWMLTHWNAPRQKHERG